MQNPFRNERIFLWVFPPWRMGFRLNGEIPPLFLTHKRGGKGSKLQLKLEAIQILSLCGYVPLPL
ncbi:hypothetical protein B0A71_01555 [Flavobacterium tructae]|uniref:Uncharacterized protein n=1 Tax=Flavobacterium tructae TaxID=1114873 RepID=A0A1S1J9I3_9FLAO|nr:hypothetical protein BHE19_01530 [Flavobacterium tructae]OXB22183.1 hypothetical protein B0A71_01555 [Flavobacterium tructae]